MSAATLSPPGVSPGGVPIRPKFNSHITSDRLRVGSGLLAPPFKTGCNIRKGRQSVFKEMGLDDRFESGSYESPMGFEKVPDNDDDAATARARQPEDNAATRERQASPTSKPWYAKLTNSKA